MILTEMCPSANLATVIGRVKVDIPAFRDAPQCWSLTKTANVASHLPLLIATYPSQPLNPTKKTRTVVDLDPVGVPLKAEEIPVTQKIEDASKRTPMSDPLKDYPHKDYPSTYPKELRSWPDLLNKNLFLSCSNQKSISVMYFLSHIHAISI